MEVIVFNKLRSLAALLCILLVIGCSSSGGGSDDPDNPGGDPTPVNTVKTPTYNVESGSYSNIIALTMSCATEGASIHYTLDGTAPTADSATYTGIIVILDETTVKAVAVKDGMNISSVKTAEYEFHYFGRNESGDGGAYYYLDGVKNYLTMPSDRTHFASRGVFKSAAGEIYVYGIAYNREITPDGFLIQDDQQPCYWKDGTYHALPLPEGCSDGIVTYSWTFFNGKFCVTGSVYDDDGGYPCYWIGDECVILDDEGSVSDGIRVTDSGDVFVPGYIAEYDGGARNVPVCWRNTTRMYMDIPASSDGTASNVTFDGSDLYVSGNVDGDPCYWKNGELTRLDVPSFSTYGEVGQGTPNKVFIHGTDVYVGGWVQLIREGGGYMTPMYWKNGVASIVPIPGKPEASGGVWGFYLCDDTVIPCGEWDSAKAYGEFCVIDGTVYFTERSQ